MKTKYYILGALVLIALVLLFFLLKEPKPTDSHRDDYARVVAENKQLHAEHAADLKKVDSLTTSGRAKDSVIAVLKAEKKATQKELDKSTAAAIRLAKEIKVLQQGDTSALARKADSLAEQAMNYAFLYEQYKQYGDSLTAQMERQSGDYATALAEMKRMYAELKKQHDALLAAYKTLFDDYAKNQKTVRRERLKTKIAALLALIGGAAAVVK